MVEVEADLVGEFIISYVANLVTLWISAITGLTEIFNEVQFNYKVMVNLAAKVVFKFQQNHKHM